MLPKKEERVGGKLYSILQSFFGEVRRGSGVRVRFSGVGGRRPYRLTKRNRGLLSLSFLFRSPNFRQSALAKKRKPIHNPTEKY